MVEVAVEFWWNMLLTIFQAKEARKSSSQTSPEIRHPISPKLSPTSLWKSLVLMYVRDTPSAAGNSMTGSERPSPEPLLKKEASPAVLRGERILEMLWKPQMPWIIGFGASQPYSRGEFQETLWEPFRGSFRNFSGISSGKSQPYWGYGPWNQELKPLFAETQTAFSLGNRQKKGIWNQKLKPYGFGLGHGEGKGYFLACSLTQRPLVLSRSVFSAILRHMNCY